MENISQNRQTSSMGETPIIHDIPTETTGLDELPMKKAITIFTLVIVMGIASGFVLSYLGKAKSSSNVTKSGSKMSEKDDVSKSAGIADKKTFKDSAEGSLEENEENAEVGSFRLVRPGGDSQTVYLTSSTVDMSEFVGKKVRVYGETFASDKVGWLMDVGFIEILK